MDQITFRLLPLPNCPYKVKLVYQKAPTLFTSVSELWGVPDNMETIFTNFMLFLILDYVDDPRAVRYRQIAESQLLARAEGLSQMDRNMFLGNFAAVFRETMAKRLSTQQGSQARDT